MSLQLFPLAQSQPDTGLMLESHMAVGQLAFYRGDLMTARTHLEQSLRVSDARQPLPHALPRGQEPGVTALAWLVQPLWVLGYADQARQRGRRPWRWRARWRTPQSGVCGGLYDHARPVLPRRHDHARPR